MSASHFNESGYAIVPALIDFALIDSTRKRIAERLARERETAEFIAGAKGTIHVGTLDEELPEIVERLHDRSLMSLLESHIGHAYSRCLSYRSRQPGHGAQTLHTDWASVRIGEWVVANVFIALCDIDASNGGTRLVPRSHREVSRFQAKSPAHHHPKEIVPRLAAGDALIFSGHMLHSGTRNQSLHERPLLIANYTRK